ncbi:hypothetical protein YC2023_101487 [Brassica napus]
MGIYRRTVVVGIYRRTYIRRNLPTNLVRRNLPTDNGRRYIPTTVGLAWKTEVFLVRAIRSSSYELKSQKQQHHENKQKELSKSGATPVEKTRLQKNSKEAGMMDAKTWRDSLPVRSLPKGSSEKQSNGLWHRIPPTPQLCMQSTEFPSPSSSIVISFVLHCHSFSALGVSVRV